MSPYGEVIRRRDSRDNYEVLPEECSRRVIFVGSDKLELQQHQRMLYGHMWPGDYVDFAAHYAPVEEGININEIPVTGPNEDYWYLRYTDRTNEPDFQSIEQILSNVDVSGVNSLVLFDPTLNPREDEFYFITIAKTEQEIKSVLGRIDVRVKEGISLRHYVGSNGLFGQEYCVYEDFRSRVIMEPWQKGILFIPIEALVYEDFYEGLNISTYWVEMEVLKHCVESARLD